VSEGFLTLRKAAVLMASVMKSLDTLQSGVRYGSMGVAA